ncbi:MULTISPECIES: hypothetical protein [Streptomyces]|uniref:hypothetical protein n=1 Tax=Streptomyces TaxID=1883 RepID=UPI00069B3F4D|nr:MULTISPECIES: hypothetical protein [Streptomyces]MYU53411.1 hypothetical protein [Streptomyces sp. SID7805]
MERTVVVSTAQNPCRSPTNHVGNRTPARAGYATNSPVTSPAPPEVREFYTRYGDPRNWTADVFKTYLELGGAS